MQPIDVSGELDAQREPLRRLAAALLGDVHAAEDVVQDAFAAALTRASQPKSLAAWLRAVVRRLALDRKRRAARRTSRESAVARPEGLDERASLERLELVEALAREVRALAEPYRTAVRLRYFDGLAQGEIARKLGLSVATVESRLVRAREELRERLDRHGGRERWFSAALAWTRPAEVPWQEVVLMKALAKVALVAGLVGLAWFGWDRLRGEVRVPDASASENAALVQPASVMTPAAASGAARIALAAAPEPSSLPAAPVAPLAGLVLDADGRPVADVEVGFLAEGESTVRAEPRAKSGADGRFAIEDPQASGSLRALGENWFTLGAPPVGARALPCERIVCVAPRAPLEGVVVDGDGVPLADVRVDLRLSAPQFPGLATDFAPSAQRVVSASDGTYRFVDAPLAQGSLRTTRRGSMLEINLGLEEARAARGRIVFTYRELLFTVHGQVVDAHEQPIEGAYVDLDPKGPQAHERRGRSGLRTDARGEFEFPIQRGQPGMVVTAAARGYQAVTLESPADPTRADSWSTPLVLRLERAALSIRGRVLDQQGAPLSEAWVDIVDGTPWGTVQKDEGPLEPWAEYTWEALAAGRGWTEHMKVDTQGRFELGELAERTYRALAFDARSLHWTLSDPIAAGEENVTLAIDTSSLRERVAGRVVDTVGAPVAGARVTLSATAPLRVEASGESDDFAVPSPARTTGADGRFEFPDVSFDADYVSVQAPSASWFSGYAFLSEFQDAAEVVVVLPRVTFVQVEIAEGTLDPSKAPTDVLGVDARDMWLDNNVGGSNLMRGSFKGTNHTDVFPIGDTARVLVVRHYGDNVLRIPVELEPGKVNLIRR